MLIANYDNIYYTTLYTSDLKVCSNLSNYHIISAVYYKKYNLFCCLVQSGSIIKFIEPNGLEHGEDLLLRRPASKVFIMELSGDELLITADFNKNFTDIYYFKNFFWYHKLLIQQPTIAIENNSLLSISNSKIYKHFIYSEYSHGFVINGDKIFRTDLHIKRIPPPFYDESVSLDEDIEGPIFTIGDSMLAIHSNKIKMYHFGPNNDSRMVSNSITIDTTKVDAIQISTEKFIKILLDKISKTNLTEQLTNCSLNQPIWLEYNIMRRDLLITNIAYFNNLAIINIDNSICLVNGTNFTKYLLFESLPLVKNLDNELLLIFRNGMLYYNGYYNLELDITGKLLIYKTAPDLVYIFNKMNVWMINKKLQTHKLILTGVSSFITYNNYLIYIIKNKLMIMTGDGTNQAPADILAYVDDNQTLLEVINGQIVSQSRFGTLESINCRVIINEVIKEWVIKNEYKKAADLCDKNNISYSILYLNGKCAMKIVNELSANQVIKLLAQINWTKDFVIESEKIEILKRKWFCIMTNKQVFDELLAHGYDSVIDRLMNYEDESNQSIISSQVFDQLINKVDHNNLNFNSRCDQIIYMDDPLKSFNNLVNSLDLKNDLIILVNIFINIDRIDLLFYFDELSKILAYLLTKISKDIVIKSAIQSLDINRIRMAYQACNMDISKLFSIIGDSAVESLSDYHKFKLMNFIGFKSVALQYLLIHECSLTEFVKEYVIENELFYDLIFYLMIGIVKFNIHDWISDFIEPKHAFWLAKSAGDSKMALTRARQELLWREAIEAYGSKEYGMEFIELMMKNKRYLEAGKIYEEYFENHDEAFLCYLAGENYEEASKLIKENEVKKEKEIIKEMKSKLNYLIIEIEEGMERIKRLKERLSGVRKRIEEGIGQSQTTFSRSSQKSVRKALIRDRPGGQFENEFVLNKIREELERVAEMIRTAQRIKQIAKELRNEELSGRVERVFECRIKEIVRDADELWNYKRPDIDETAPQVPRPNLNLNTN